MWRSLVAYTPGGRGVAGSNPVIPTKEKPSESLGFFIFLNVIRTGFLWLTILWVIDTSPHPKHPSGLEVHATDQRAMAAGRRAEADLKFLK